MGGLMKGYADGLQDSRSRNAESASAAAQRDAYDAERRASQAQRHANEIKALAASWKQDALRYQGTKDGFKALFLALYRVHVDSLQGDARDRAHKEISIAAKRWISTKCSDAEKALIREAWGASGMQPWNQTVGLVPPPKPVAVPVPQPPKEPTMDVVEIRRPHLIFSSRPAWHYAGVDFDSESDARKAKLDAEVKYQSECRAWHQAVGAAGNQYRKRLAEYESWTNKFGDDF